MNRTARMKLCLKRRWTQAELGAWLQLSEQTIRRMVKRRELLTMRRGRYRLISGYQVAKLMRRSCNVPLRITDYCDGLHRH